MQVELRDYQVATRDRVLSIHKDNPKGKAKFVHATGLGKTVCFSAIAVEIRKRTNTNVLIIAHRDELLTQAAQKYRYIDPDAQIGKVGGGYQDWGHPITVASIQTIARPNHLKNLKHFGFGLVIVDEVHHAHSGNEYGKVLAQLEDAFKLGCTATDDRMDRITNDDLFGESVHTVSILDGVEQGYLTNVKAVAIKTGTSLDGLHTKEGDYQVKELAEKIDTPERNRKIVEGYLEHASDRQAMAFTVDINHADHLADAFNEAGVKAVAVSGKTPNRSAILKDFETGKYRVLCNCQVFTEGYDAETSYDEDEGRYIFLSCAIMARPTKSRSLYAQCIGRILRLAPTKTDALILDATDNVLNHRLEPQSLARVTGVDLQDGETLLEAKERKEVAVREKRERKIDVKRDQDITINVLARLNWQSRSDGKFVLEVGQEKHRIALIPSSEIDGYYRVAARLAPRFEMQWWSNEYMPLDWAQGQAERKARMLLSDAKSVKLIDRNAAWRQDSATETQLEKLAKYQRRFNFQYNPETVTKGEAADMLDVAYQSFEKWRKAKEARSAAV